MRLRDVMTRGVDCVGPTDSVQSAAKRMRDLDVGSIPVCDNDRLAGMVTDRDIAIRCTAEGHDPNTCRVQDVMTPDVVYGMEDQTVEDAEQVMRGRKIRRLVVLDKNKRMVGIVSLGDLAVRTGHPEQAGEVLHDVAEAASAGQ
jgi:CBS domain-containing protein